MRIGRRGFLGMATAAGAAAFLPVAVRGSASTPSLPPAIGRAERMARIDKAQRLMRAAGLRALLVEAGSSLVYFSGIQWWRSERLTAALIPADGRPLVVTPAFEEASVRESLEIEADVRAWNENEDPGALIADWLRSKGAKSGPVGVEDSSRSRDCAGTASRRGVTPEW